MKFKHLRIPILICKPVFVEWTHEKVVKSFWEGDVSFLWFHWWNCTFLMKHKTYIGRVSWQICLARQITYLTNSSWEGPSWFYCTVVLSVWGSKWRGPAVAWPFTRRFNKAFSQEHQGPSEMNNFMVIKGILFNSRIQSLQNVCIFLYNKKHFKKKIVLIIKSCVHSSGLSLVANY